MLVEGRGYFTETRVWSGLFPAVISGSRGTIPLALLAPQKRPSSHTPQKTNYLSTPLPPVWCQLSEPGITIDSQHRIDSTAEAGQMSAKHWTSTANCHRWQMTFSDLSYSFIVHYHSHTSHGTARQKFWHENFFFGFFKLGVMRECIRVTLFTGHTYSRSEYTLYLVPSIPLKVFYRFISIFWDITVESFLTYIRVIPISWDSPFTPKETIFFQNSCVESTHSLLYHQWSHPAGPR